MMRLRHLRIWAVNGHQWVAGALLALFLGVLAVTLSEALHRALHADACSPQHQCAVTLFQSGQVEAPVVPITIVGTGAAVFVALPPQSQFVSSVDFSLPPSCGPPARFA